MDLSDKLKRERTFVGKYYSLEIRFAVYGYGLNKMPFMVKSVAKISMFAMSVNERI